MQRSGGAGFLGQIIVNSRRPLIPTVPRRIDARNFASNERHFLVQRRTHFAGRHV